MIRTIPQGEGFFGQFLARRFQGQRDRRVSDRLKPGHRLDQLLLRRIVQQAQPPDHLDRLASKLLVVAVDDERHVKAPGDVSEQLRDDLLGHLHLGRSLLGRLLHAAGAVEDDGQVADLLACRGNLVPALHGGDERVAGTVALQLVHLGSAEGKDGGGCLPTLEDCRFVDLQLQQFQDVLITHGGRGRSGRRVSRLGGPGLLDGLQDRPRDASVLQPRDSRSIGREVDPVLLDLGHHGIVSDGKLRQRDDVLLTQRLRRGRPALAPNRQPNGDRHKKPSDTFLTDHNETSTRKINWNTVPKVSANASSCATRGLTS